MKCRRTSISALAILCLTFLGAYRGLDVAIAIATVAGALSGANAAEKAYIGGRNGSRIEG